jgi:hypothetical protein
MLASIERNMSYLRSFFEGRTNGHAIVMNPIEEVKKPTGDLILSEEPVSKWRDWGVRLYEAQLEWHEGTGDDSVPYVDSTHANTAVFAAAFGCPVHVYEGLKANAAARPAVASAEEADALVEPSIDDSPTLRRVLEFAHVMADALGPDVPVAVPDIQSPFDVAAMVWRKEDFFVACALQPEAVRRLVLKCERLLMRFLDRYLAELPNVNMCHCPRAWSPPDLGLWLSEDEVGSVSPATFESLSLPSLSRLSERYGGISIHCCAKAAHQYPSFRKIPNFRAWQRVFADDGGARVALEAWPDKPFVVAWHSEEEACELKAISPGTRFLINMEAQESLEESRALFGRLREVFPRGD